MSSLEKMHIGYNIKTHKLGIVVHVLNLSTLEAKTRLISGFEANLLKAEYSVMHTSHLHTISTTTSRTCHPTFMFRPK